MARIHSPYGGSALFRQAVFRQLHFATHAHDVPAFASPAFSTPGNLVPCFPVPSFSPLRFGPTFSSLDFQSRVFSPPSFIMYVYACICLTASHAPSPMSCAKTTEPIEMAYAVSTLIGPINHVFGWSGSPHTEMDTLCIEQTLAHPGLPTTIQTRRYSQR